METAEANKALVSEVYERVFNGHDLGAINDLYAEEYVDHNELVPPGRNGYREFFAPLLAAFPDWRGSVGDMVAEGDLVAVRSTWTGTQTGDLPGIPATGRQVSYAAMDFFRIAGGRVAEHWDQVDNLTMLQQLGVLPEF